MYECIIVYRTQNDVQCVRDPEDVRDIAIFPHIDSAVAYCQTTKPFKDGKVPYQIVELDEL